MKKKRIMIVEDNSLYAMVLDYNLKEDVSNTIISVGSGEECIASLDWKPDIVVLDYQLPGMNGLETLKKIKELNKNINIIVLTNQTDLKVAVELMNAGAFQYIEKRKYSFEQLIEFIEKGS